MSEPENQVEDVVQEVEQVEEVEQQEAASELATDTETEQEANTETDADTHQVNQDKINRTINKFYREKMEAKEEAERLQRELEKFKQTQEPEIPPMPDPFDDNYEDKVRQRDEALALKARRDAEQQVLAERRQQEQLAQMQATVSGYAEKATKLGLDQTEWQQNLQVAGQYIQSDDLGMAILSDPEGPLLTQYLAQNPMDAINLNQLNPYQAAQFIETQVRPKARELKPKTTQAPPPPTQVKSTGANIDESDPFLQGATFE